MNQLQWTDYSEPITVGWLQWTDYSEPNMENWLQWTKYGEPITINQLQFLSDPVVSKRSVNATDQQK